MATENNDMSATALIMAALTFVISLAWNDAFKSFFQKSTPWLRKYGPWAYAIFVTIIGLLAVFSVNRYVANNNENPPTDVENET